MLAVRRSATLSTRSATRLAQRRFSAAIDDDRPIGYLSDTHEMLRYAAHSFSREHLPEPQRRTAEAC